MSKRSEYWWYQNLYTPLEIKKINKSIKSSILEEKGSPAEHVVKTSDVKLFKLGNVPLLERFVLSPLAQINKTLVIIYILHNQNYV